MGEYVKREYVIDAVLDVYFNTPDINLSCEKFEAAIRKIPAADVSPVRHGKWIDGGDYVTTAYGSLPVKMCSECHMDVTLEDFDSYCPNCGAKMDLSDEC